MTILTVTTGLWDGLTLSELKARTLSRLKQKAGNYDRYSEGTINDALNDALQYAGAKLKHVRGFGIIRMKSGFRQYKGPSDMISPEALYFYSSATSYWEVDQKTRRWLNSWKSGWRSTSGDPLFYYPGDSYGTFRKIGFYPKPDTDGEDYTIDPDTGVFVSESGMTVTGNITGTVAGTSATDCEDSAARTLSDLGVYAGMMLVNVTTNESGQIISVSGSTAVCDAADFATGFTLGDSFTILAGEYGIIIDWTADEHYLFTAEIGGMIDVAPLSGNVLIEYVRRPLPLAVDGQYPQLPPELHQYLPDGAVWVLKRNSPRGSSDFNEATVAKQSFDQGMDLYTDQDAVAEDDNTGDYNL